jgi:hypothetical protein
MSVPQHKASPSELEDRAKGEANWHPSQQPFEWIHAGSLSSGYWGYFKDTPLPEMTDANKADFETRCAFWNIAAAMGMNGFDDFYLEYCKGIVSVVKRAGLNVDNIEKKINLYRNLLGV